MVDHLMRLVDEAVDAMSSLGIPRVITKKDNHSDLYWVTQGYVLSHDVIPIIYGGPKNEIGHSIRVAKHGIIISDILGFEQNGSIIKFLTDIAHDRGKLKFKDCYNELLHNETAKQKLRRGHVLAENVAQDYGIIPASAMEQHHRHQKTFSDPHPAHLYFPQSPESFLLSQLTAIPDLWDALTTRPCTKTGRLHPFSEAADLLVKEYGDMQIKYEGTMFPKINQAGSQLIEIFLKKIAK